MLEARTLKNQLRFSLKSEPGPGRGNAIQSDRLSRIFYSGFGCDPGASYSKLKSSAIGHNSYIR